MSLELWQAELRSLVVGEGTSYEASGPIGGLGLPKTRTHDSARGDRTGEVGGDDTLPRRVLSLPLNIDAGTAAAIWPLRTALISAWRESADDVELGLLLPGMDTPWTFFGRARGADVDLEDLKSGHAGALCTFEALDPLAYLDAIVEGELSDDFTIDNPGEAPTDRISVRIIGDGGIPRLELASGGFVQFVDALGAADEIVLGFRDRTVVDGDDVDRWAKIANVSPWFLLEPGENELELSGASSAEITYRPAFR